MYGVYTMYVCMYVCVYTMYVCMQCLCCTFLMVIRKKVRLFPISGAKIYQ